MKVGELFLALGLAVDDKEWNVGHEVIKRLQAELRELAVKALMATTDVNKAMGVIGLSPPAKAAKKSLRDLVSEGSKVSDTFKRMAMAAAGFFAVDRLKEMVLGTVELGGKINDVAQKAGISTDALQELSYAAGMNSGTMDDVTSGALALSKNLEKIDKGGPAADALKKLGISLDDPAVKGRNLEQIMYLTASAFSQMEDSAYKSQIAMALYGKSGANLIPTLNQGVQGLADLRREARESGNVIDKDGIGQLDDLGDQLDKAKASMAGLKNQIVLALVPAIKDVAIRFREWVKENREVIRTTATRVVSVLVSALRTLGTVVAFAIKHWKVFAALLGAMTIVNGIMAIARAILLFQAIQVTAAGKAVIAWAAIIGPILLVAAAVVAVGLVIYKFRDKVWSALKAIGGFFVSVWNEIKLIAKGIAAPFIGAFTAIKDMAVAVFDFIADKIIWVIEKIEAAISRLADLATNFADAFGDQVDLDALDKQVRAELKAKIDRGEIDEETAKSLYKLNMGQVGLDRGDMERIDAYQRGAGTRQGAGGGAGVPVAPSREPAGSGNGVNSTTSYQINIDAKNADAKEVASLVDLKLREHDERQRRQMAASLGVA